MARGPAPELVQTLQRREDQKPIESLCLRSAYPWEDKSRCSLSRMDCGVPVDCLFAEFIDGTTLETMPGQKKRLNWGETSQVLALQTVQHHHRAFRECQGDGPRDRQILNLRQYHDNATFVKTPNYMPSEQARWNSKIEKRANIFSLGCILNCVLREREQLFETTFQISLCGSSIKTCPSSIATNLD